MHRKPVVRRLAAGVIAVGIGVGTFVGITGAAAAQLSSADQEQMLAKQNEHRAEVGTPPMQWDASLAATAQGVADKLLATNSNAHSTNEVGENLFSAGSSDPSTLSPLAAVASWYGERQNFLNGTGVSGHYTQMVSSRVKSVGCGEAKGANKIVVVCQYRPQGNDGKPPFGPGS